MLGIFSGAKMVFMGVILTAVVGGFLYVKGLQKDLAVAKENMIKMEQAISDQKKVIEQQKIDFEAIIKANKELVEQQNKLTAEYKSLDTSLSSKYHTVSKPGPASIKSDPPFSTLGLEDVSSKKSSLNQVSFSSPYITSSKFVATNISIE